MALTDSRSSRLDQAFALRANQGAEEEEILTGLSAGRDPFAPLAPGSRCVFHALVMGVRPWCLPLAVSLATSPQTPGHRDPQDDPSRSLIIRMIREGCDTDVIHSVRAGLVEKGAVPGDLDEVAQNVLSTVLNASIQDRNASADMVISALRFIRLTPATLQEVWPAKSRAIAHLTALMDAIDPPARFHTMVLGLSATTGWGQRALVAMAPFHGANRLLERFQKWAGETGKKWLAGNSHMVLETAIKSCPRHAMAWLKRCGSIQGVNPWQELLVHTGSGPWEILMPGVESDFHGNGKKALDRIRAAHGWIKKPEMGWVGAWEGWLNLVKSADELANFVPATRLIPAARQLGHDLVHAGALDRFSPDTLPMVETQNKELNQVMEEAGRVVLEKHLSLHLPQPGPNRASRPGRF